MEFSLLAIIVGIVLAAIELLLGVAVGWWLRGGQDGDHPPINNEEAERARQALQRLHELATSVAADVGEHSSRVQAISNELTSKQPDDELDSVVIDTVAQIMEANTRLQKQLASAESRLQEQAQQIEVHAADALTDSLTGTANRRAFDQQLAQRIADWQRRGTPLSLLMVDVDHFKKFNDTHGHLAGDEVLRGVAEVLNSTVRNADVVARFGGEEFAIIMPGTDLKTAGPMAEKARAAIEAAEFAFEGTTLKVTASEGVAQVMSGDDISSLVRRADEALYASKNAGRNNVHSHDGKSAKPVTLKMLEEAEAAETAVASNPEEQATDQQTGLPNRTAFFEEVRHRVAESQRYGTRLSLMIVHIDLLHDIVRQHGKTVGDLMLRTVTQFLSAALREMDLVARYEDEAFAVLMPGIALEHAVGIGERLRAAIARCPLRLKDAEVHFTISLGIAEAVPADDSASMVKRAHAAMNASVQAGRDCTHFHDGQACQACETVGAVLR